jgi:hypothetical protein
MRSGQDWASPPCSPICGRSTDEPRRVTYPVLVNLWSYSVIIALISYWPRLMGNQVSLCSIANRPILSRIRHNLKIRLQASVAI